MRNIAKNKKTQYIIGIAAIIIVAIILFDGRHWMHRMDYINWPQVLIGLCIGVLIGLFLSKRK
jgi:hypothetical protein